MEETALASAEAPRLTVVEVKVSVSISKIDALAAFGLVRMGINGVCWLPRMYQWNGKRMLGLWALPASLATALCLCYMPFQAAILQ